MYLYSLSKNSRVLSEWEQRTYCKGLLVANHSTWDKFNAILSKKPDYKILPFIACSVMNYYNISEYLPHLFNQFTSDEKQDVAISRSCINTFYLIIIKYVNVFHILDELLLNLPRMKPE